MDPMALILISAFLGIGALIFGVGNILHGRRATQAESRLAAFTNAGTPNTNQIADDIVRDGLTSASGIIGKLLGRFKNLPMFFQQAESPLRIEPFILLCAGTAAERRTDCGSDPISGCIDSASCHWWLWLSLDLDVVASPQSFQEV